jgi:hypothetical protein
VIFFVLWFFLGEILEKVVHESSVCDTVVYRFPNFHIFKQFPFQIPYNLDHVIFFVLGILLKRWIPWWSACGSVSPPPSLKTVSSLNTTCLSKRGATNRVFMIRAYIDFLISTFLSYSHSKFPTIWTIFFNLNHRLN